MNRRIMRRMRKRMGRVLICFASIATTATATRTGTRRTATDSNRRSRTTAKVKHQKSNTTKK